MLKKCVPAYLVAVLISLTACQGGSSENDSKKGSQESEITPVISMIDAEPNERSTLRVDGSESTTTADSIESYTWQVIEDGLVAVSYVGTETALAALPLGDVSADKVMQLVLTVTDSTNNTATTSMNIKIKEIDESLLPPSPGDLGSSQLMGVDSNDNSVRDDVEREIYNLHKDMSYQDRSVFWMVAHHLQDAIAFGAGQSTSEADSIVDNISYGIDCLNQIDSASAEKWYAELKILSINTVERLTAFEAFNLSRNGTVQHILAASEQQCAAFAE